MKNFSQKSTSVVAAASLFLMIWLIPSPAVQAQMFSVTSTPEQPSQIFEIPNSLSFGLEFSDFSYFGPSDDLPEFLYNFDGTLYTLRFDSQSLSLYIADRTSLGPDGDIRATRVGIGLHSLSNLSLTSRARFAIPFGINTDYTLVRTSETANTSDEFAQNSLYLQSGLDVLVRLTGSLFLHSVTAPNIGYSVGQLGSTGGISYKLRQDVRLNANDIYRGFGFTAGYTFQFSRYSNTDRQFRYDWTGHTVVLGFTF